MTPSLPTFSITSAMRSPISGPRRDGGDLGDLLLALDRGGLGLDLGDERVRREIDAALEQHGVGAGGDVAHALADDGLGQDGRGGGAVAGDVVGLGGGLLEQLRAHVGEVVLELDLLGDGDAVVGDGRGAVLLVEGDVAALGAERGLDRVGQGVHTLLQGLAGRGVELQNLGHAP